MKTPFLSFRIFTTTILAFLFSSVTIAQTTNTTEAINNAKEIRPLNANTSELMPYDYPNFEAWAKLQDDKIIWLYLSNENYRELVNNWNKTNNPFWAAAIVGSCPYGTFDFTAGLAETDDVNNYGTLQEHQRFDYNLNPIKQTNILGQPYFSSKVEGANVAAVPVNMLPTRDPRLVMVKNYTVAKPNFTKNIPSKVVFVDSYQPGQPNYNPVAAKRNQNNSHDIHTSMSANQSYYEQGIGGMTTTNGLGNSSNRYNGFSNAKSSSGQAPVEKTSQPSKTASTSGTITTPTNKS